ncbi:MAG: hypothetical protein GY847_18390, partial [Proteobacteria bacterium]|nr:hypothetical protein [Pseudomonadota bacterium]
DYVKQYNDLKKDAEIFEDNVTLFSNLAIGFGVSAGAFALATVTVLVIDLRKSESKDTEITAVPGGIIVSF